MLLLFTDTGGCIDINQHIMLLLFIDTGGSIALTYTAAYILIFENVSFWTQSEFNVVVNKMNCHAFRVYNSVHLQTALLHNCPVASP